MKKSLSRIMASVLALVIVTSVVGCGSDTKKATDSTAASTTSSTTESAASSQAAKDPNKPWLDDTSPITIDWYVDESNYTRAKWGQDLVSKNVTKKTGVSLNITIPIGDATAKKTAMIASNDLPDVMSMGNYYPEWKTMQENGMLYSFDELKEKYDPTLTTVMYQSTLNYYKAKDGKSYVYPSNSWPAEEVKNAKYLLPGNAISVRKDIYEAIGKPDMTTQEGFLNALKLAKEKFPKVDGKNIIPYLFGGEFTASSGNSFFADALPVLLGLPLEKDGVFTKQANRKAPEVASWIKTFRKAFELGYITSDQFTNKQAQIDDTFKTGAVFATGMGANKVAELSGAFYNKDPNKTYIPVDAIWGAQKARPTVYTGNCAGWLVNMITKKAKNPDRIVKFMHYWLADEGQEDFYFGDETMWEMVNGKKQLKTEIFDLRGAADEGKEFFTKYGARDTYYMLMESNFADKFRQKVDPWYQPYYDFYKGKITNSNKYEANDPEANTPAGIAWTKDKTLYGQYIAKMLTAKSDADFDKIYNEYKAQSDELQKEWLPAMQEKFDAKVKLLGK